MFPELELARAEGKADALANMLSGRTDGVDPKKVIPHLAKLAEEVRDHLERVRTYQPQSAEVA